MGNGPPNSTTDEDTGRRFYEHPLTGEVFTSITTSLEPISKFGLVMWSGQLAARAAILELTKLVQAVITRPCGRSTTVCKHNWRVRCADCRCTRCEECLYRYLSTRHAIESKRRSNEGTAAHAAINWWVLNGEWMPPEVFCNDDNRVDPKLLRPYIERFKQLAADYGITPADFLLTETTVINRTLMAGGTTDGIVRVYADRTDLARGLCARLGYADYADVMFDIKTREKTKEQSNGRVVFYDDNPLQLAGYDLCDTVMLRNGDEHPRPPVDAHAIVQLRPDGYEFRPARIEDWEREAFVAALQVFRWCAERGTKQMALKQFPNPAKGTVLRTHDKPTHPLPDPTDKPTQSVPSRRQPDKPAPAGPAQPDKPSQAVPPPTDDPGLPPPTQTDGPDWPEVTQPPDPAKTEPKKRTRPAVTVPAHQQGLRDAVLGRPRRDSDGLFEDPKAEEIPF
jgi:hypothetical protein